MHHEDPIEKSSKNDQRPYQNFTKDEIKNLDHETKQKINHIVKSRPADKIKPKANCRSKVQTSVYVNDLYEQPVCESPASTLSGSSVPGLQQSLWRPTGAHTIRSHAFAESNSYHGNTVGFNRPLGGNMIHNSYSCHKTNPVAAHSSLDQRQNHNSKAGLVESSINHGYSMNNKCDYSQNILEAGGPQSIQHSNQSQKFLTAKQQRCDMSAMCQNYQRKYETAPYMSYTDYLVEYSKALCCMQNKMLLQDENRRSKLSTIDGNDSLSIQSEYHAHPNPSKIHNFTGRIPVDCKRLTDAAIKTHQNEVNTLNKSRLSQNKLGPHIVLNSVGLPDRPYAFQDYTHVVPHNQTISREKNRQLVQGGQLMTCVKQNTENSIRRVPYIGPKCTTNSPHYPAIWTLNTRNENERKHRNKNQIKNYEMFSGTKSSCNKEQMDNVNNICEGSNAIYTSDNAVDAVMQNGVDDNLSSHLEYRKSAVPSIMYQTVCEKQLSPKQRMLQKFQHEIKSPNTVTRETNDPDEDVSKETTFQHQMTVGHLQANDQLNNSDSICLPYAIRETGYCKGKLIEGSNYLTLDASIGGSSSQENDPTSESVDIAIDKTNHLITEPENQLNTSTNTTDIMIVESVESIDETLKDDCTKVSEKNSSQKVLTSSTKRKEIVVDSSVTEAVPTGNRMNENKEPTTIVDETISASPDETLSDSVTIEESLLLESVPLCDSISLSLNSTVNEWSDVPITIAESVSDIFVQSDKSNEENADTSNVEMAVIESNSAIKYTVTEKDEAIDTGELNIDDSQPSDNHIKYYIIENIDDKDDNNKFISFQHQHSSANKALDTTTEIRASEFGSEVKNDNVSLENNSVINTVSTFLGSHSDPPKSADGVEHVGNNENEKIESKTECVVEDNGYEVLLQTNPSEEPVDGLRKMSLQTEIVNVCTDGQVGDDSFFDCIETEESSFYRTCLDQEEPLKTDIVLQNLSAQSNLTNEQTSYLLDAKIDKHSSDHECFKSLEETIVQHLNKSIEIISQSPPQTVDSTNIMQIQKNLQCFNQRIQSAPNDELPLSHSRKVIWDILQLCGSCMIVSQVALDRLKSLVGKTVKNQLGFYPDMFIDTLTILFKQASIASTMASNISDDLFFELSSDNSDNDSHIGTEKALPTDNAPRLQNSEYVDNSDNDSPLVIEKPLLSDSSPTLQKSESVNIKDNDLPFVTEKPLPTDSSPTLQKRESVDSSDNDSPVVTEKPHPTDSSPTIQNSECVDNSDNDSPIAIDKPLSSDITPPLPNCESVDNSDINSPMAIENPFPTDNSPTLPHCESVDNSHIESPMAIEKPFPTDNSSTLPHCESVDNSHIESPMAIEKLFPTLQNDKSPDNIEILLKQGNTMKQRELSSECAKNGTITYENNKLYCFNSNEVDISEKHQNPEIESRENEYVDRENPKGTSISFSNTQDHSILINGETRVRPIETKISLTNTNNDHIDLTTDETNVDILNNQKSCETSKDNVKAAEHLTCEGQNDSTIELKPDKRTMFTYRNEYFEYKRKRKIKRLSETTGHRSRQSKRDFYCKRRPRSSNFGNSKSCRKLKKDLFELGSKDMFHGIKVPSSIVLNYNEASQFCCHVVLTRTPVTHTKLVSHDRKRSICNQQKSNTDIWRETNKHANLAKHERCLNRSSSDSNLISKFLENSYKDNEYSKSFQSKLENDMKVGPSITSMKFSGRPDTVNSRPDNQSNERSASEHETKKMCHDNCEKSNRKEHEIEQNICQSYSINTVDNSNSLNNCSVENILPENSSPKTEYEIVRKYPELDCGFKTSPEKRESRAHPKLVPELFLRRVMNKTLKPENVNDSNVHSDKKYEKIYSINDKEKSAENISDSDISSKENEDLVYNDKLSVQYEVLKEEKKIVGNKENDTSHAKNYKRNNTLPRKPISTIRSHGKLSFEEEISRLDYSNSRKKSEKGKASDKGDGSLPLENAKCSKEKKRMNRDSNTFSESYITDKTSACKRQNHNSVTDVYSFNKSSTYEKCKSDDAINKTYANLVANKKDANAIVEQRHKTRKHKKKTKHTNNKEMVTCSPVKQAPCPQDHFEKLKMSFEKNIGSDLPKCQSQSFVKGLVTSLREKLCNQTTAKPGKVISQSFLNDSDSPAQSFGKSQLKRTLSCTRELLSLNTQKIKDIDKNDNNNDKKEQTLSNDGHDDDSNGKTKKSQIQENIEDMANIKQRHDYATKKSKREDKHIKLQLSSKDKDRKYSRQNATQKLKMHKSTKRSSSERIPSSQGSPTKKIKIRNKVKEVCLNESQGKQKHKSQSQHESKGNQKHKLQSQYESLLNSKSRMTIENEEASTQLENLVCERTVQRVFHDRKEESRNSRPKQAPNEKPNESNKSQDNADDTMNVNLKQTTEHSRYTSTNQEEDISRIGKWSKLSDIYNVQPLDTSDEEEEKPADTSILFSPIRFHTESGDDLPSLSLPSKKWKNNMHIAKRCHRVDMNTHKEIQKILREVVPLTCNDRKDNDADDDDDDAKTVTDFSYLEPKQKVKLRKRWNKICLKSKKSQIYSPQEYLTAAGSSVNEQVDEHELQSSYSMNGLSSKCIDSIVKNHAINSAFLSSCEETDNTEQLLENDLPSICAEVRTKEQSCKNGLQTQCLSKKKGIDLITSEREVIPPQRKRGLVCVQECFTVLDKVYNHKLSEPFREEVKSKDVPDYYKTIKRGMCYDMVAHKLRNGFYSQVEEFVDDMKLVFSNCYQYHEKNSDIYKAGVEMETFFEKKMLETFPSFKTSV
ncbi:fap1 adhesin-like isoform X1 [Mytilus edulis]|uniref:fap1 adhesin-like isoform X1 n=1 Tax=Mytilus edulis TaxID=6550 RepID=UPI0039EEA916